MDLAIAAFGGVAVIVWIIGLVDIFRYRNRMSTATLIIWLLVIFFIPIIGVVSWLLYRISKSDAMIEAMEMGNTSPDDTHLPPMR